ncbi:MAG: hypothetical protein QT00_C0001G0502 [archaeon GW2011_AR5]|nr:MAG: hypothetical protein QT00_C0001G0502 [archaeon GW2011_AR5]
MGKRYVPRADRIGLTIGDRSWTWRQLGDMDIYNPRAPWLLEFTLDRLGVDTFGKFIRMDPVEISMYAGDETGFVAMMVYMHTTHKDPDDWVSREEKPVRWSTHKRRLKKRKRQQR